MIGNGVSAISATTAHREWATRPPDERYTSVQALYEAARARRQHLDARIVDTGTFRTEAVEDDLVIRETSGRTAPLTHWSFGQLATLASAPPSTCGRSPRRSRRMRSITGCSGSHATTIRCLRRTRRPRHCSEG